MDLYIIIISVVYVWLQLTKGCSTECCLYSQLDCLDYREGGENRSGIYRIIPSGMHYGYDVYCDMTTDGGGWMVFQRREDGSENFQREWYEYLAGFGNKSHEHWLGLTPLTRILNYGFYELRIDLEDWQNNTRYAKYKVFNVDPRDSYKLTVYDYSGTAEGNNFCGIHRKMGPMIKWLNVLPENPELTPIEKGGKMKILKQLPLNV